MYSRALELFCLCILAAYSSYTYSEIHQLAFSKRMGVTVFAGNAPGWCKDQLELILEADNENFFESSEFEKLIQVIGDKVLPNECVSANRAILVGKHDKEVLWQGYADKKSGWRITEDNIKTDTKSSMPPEIDEAVSLDAFVGTETKKPASAPKKECNETPYVTIEAGQRKCGFELSKNGAIGYKGWASTHILHVQDAKHKETKATKVHVYTNSSPNDIYHVVEAMHSGDRTTNLRSSWYILDKKELTIVNITDSGPLETGWDWTADSAYLINAVNNDGVSQIEAIKTPGKEIVRLVISNCTPKLATDSSGEKPLLEWVDERTFKVRVGKCVDACCKEVEDVSYSAFRVSPGVILPVAGGTSSYQSACAQAVDNQTTFDGVWVGITNAMQHKYTGKRLLDRKDRTVRVVIDENKNEYEMTYPGMKCGGRLNLVDKNESLLVLRDKLTFGRVYDCFDNSMIRLTKNAGGGLLYEQYWDDVKGRARSVLRRDREFDAEKNECVQIEDGKDEHQKDRYSIDVTKITFDATACNQPGRGRRNCVGAGCKTSRANELYKTPHDSIQATVPRDFNILKDNQTQEIIRASYIEAKKRCGNESHLVNTCILQKDGKTRKCRAGGYVSDSGTVELYYNAVAYQLAEEQRRLKARQLQEKRRKWRQVKYEYERLNNITGIDLLAYKAGIDAADFPSELYAKRILTGENVRGAVLVRVSDDDNEESSVDWPVPMLLADKLNLIDDEGVYFVVGNVTGGGDKTIDGLPVVRMQIESAWQCIEKHCADHKDTLEAVRVRHKYPDFSPNREPK